MLCTKCGATVEIDTRLCPQCGEETGTRTGAPPVGADEPSATAADASSVDPPGEGEASSPEPDPPSPPEPPSVDPSGEGKASSPEPGPPSPPEPPSVDPSDEGEVASPDEAPEWAVAQPEEPSPDVLAAHESLTDVHPVSVPDPPAVSGAARWLGIIVLLTIVMAIIVKLAIGFWVVGEKTRTFPENKSGPKTNARPPIVIAV